MSKRLYLLFCILTTSVYATSIIKCVLWEGHYVLVHHTTVSLFHEQKLLLLLCLDTTKCKCSWSPQVCSLWCYLSKQWWTHKGPSSKRFLISCHNTRWLEQTASLYVRFSRLYSNFFGYTQNFLEGSAPLRLWYIN